MPISLTYETPRWVERRHIKGGALGLSFAILAIVMASSLSTTATILLSKRHHHHYHWWDLIGISISLTTAALVVMMLVTARSTLLVFADRIEIKVIALGFTFWKKRIPWANVSRCDLYSRWRPVSEDAPHIPQIWVRNKYSLLTFTSGWTLIMCSGDGAGLSLHNGKGFLLGSDNPQKLCEEINQARQAFAT